MRHNDMSYAQPDTAFGPNDPVRLRVAAERFFPDGTMTESGLRREASRGRLVVERIAGKHYTTLAEIERMRFLCRDDQRGRASTCANEKAENPSSSSSMEKTKSGRAAALTIAEELKRRSKPILQKSTDLTGAKVILLKS
jgi:hypothetical protein